MAVRWLSSMAIGVDEVDDQHKELFVKVNHLLEACEQGKGKDEVASIVEFLQDYVIVHFGTEQKLMTEYEYPDMTAHLAKHDAFVKEFLELKARFVQEGPNSKFLTDFNRIVVDWLVSHIAEVDAKMGEFLEDKVGQLQA